MAVFWAALICVYGGMSCLVLITRAESLIGQIRAYLVIDVRIKH